MLDHRLSDPICHQRRVRGFNLTELTIVLGVVGFVLGLIWLAASTTWEMARREQASEIVSTIVNNVRVYYTGQASIPFTGAGVDTLVPQFFSKGVIPNALQRRQSTTATCTNTSHLCADTPWGASNGAGADAHGTLQVCAWNFGASPAQTICNTSTVALSPSQFFAVQLSGLTQANCINLAPMISGSTTLPGLRLVVINSSVVVPTAAPATAKSDCKTDSTNVLVFIYNLKVSS